MTAPQIGTARTPGPECPAWRPVLGDPSGAAVVDGTRCRARSRDTHFLEPL